jgi:hypothetical protein
MHRLSKYHFLIILSLAVIALPSLCHATPEYSGKTGLDCTVCHVDGIGGKLTKDGEDFREDLKSKGLYRLREPKSVG